VSSRFGLPYLRMVGATSVSRFPKHYEFVEASNALKVFPRLVVTKIASTCIGGIVNVFGPNVQTIEKLTLLGGNCVDGDI
jgi:hypothetical protein